MLTITIEQITVPYEKELLLKWRDRDTKVVPSFMLDCDGPGIVKGYGFGEWVAEKYFRDRGNYVFTDFDILSKSSKYTRYNNMIKTLISQEQENKFKEALEEALRKGYKIENPDLFVYNLDTCFFIEAKKGRDKLREPQIRFFYLAKKYLGIDSKIVYLCHKSSEISSQELIFEFDFELEV